MDEAWYTEHNTPPGTPKELLDTLNDEVKNFRLQWLAFNDFNLNDPIGSTVLPMALSGFMYDMVHTSYHVQVSSEACDDEDTAVFNGYAAFGAIMFKFGQWCFRKGILDSNLTEIMDPENPSSTIDLSDEAFQKFLGEAGA